MNALPQAIVVTLLSVGSLVAQTAGGSYCFGVGCSADGARPPALGISGSPSPGYEYTISLSGAPAASGVLLFGLGTQSSSVLGCTLNISELLPLAVPFVVEKVDESGGTWSVTMPAADRVLPMTLQAFLVDPSGAVSATNGVGLIPGDPRDEPVGDPGDFPVDRLQPHG